MVSTEFIHDCSHCAALCCMAPTINKGARFPIDKPACTACPNLMQGGLCKVHADREELGYLGCIDFTCFGAGQRVTQEMFGGRTWQDDPKLQEPMARAFLDLFRVQESRWLLQTAAFMGIPADKEEERRAMLAELEPPADGWTVEALEAMLVRQSPDGVRSWLRSLAGGMPAPGQ